MEVGSEAKKTGETGANDLIFFSDREKTGRTCLGLVCWVFLLVVMCVLGFFCWIFGGQGARVFFVCWLFCWLFFFEVHIKCCKYPGLKRISPLSSQV